MTYFYLTLACLLLVATSILLSLISRTRRLYFACIKCVRTDFEPEFFACFPQDWDYPEGCG